MKDSKNCLPEVTGLVVPLDAIVVLVVEGSQTSLVVVLLKTLDGDADVELGGDGSLQDSLVVVRLGLAAPTMIT